MKNIYFSESSSYHLDGRGFVPNVLLLDHSGLDIVAALHSGCALVSEKDVAAVWWKRYTSVKLTLAN